MVTSHYPTYISEYSERLRVSSSPKPIARELQGSAIGQNSDTNKPARQRQVNTGKWSFKCEEFFALFLHPVFLVMAYCVVSPSAVVHPATSE